MTTTLYLVRHGETYENHNHVFQGVLDTKLTPKGLTQAKKLGPYFESIQIDKAYTSPLSRARLTAEGALANHPGVKAEVVDELHEIEGGALQGLDFDTCNKRYNNIMVTFRENPSAFDPPGGESLPQVYRRFTKAVNTLVKENLGKTILIAAHGTVIQTWINYAKGIPEDKIELAFLPNGSVSKFTFDDNMNITIDYLGDVSYMNNESNQ
jgi:broad specificity phosphatase PhoE